MADKYRMERIERLLGELEYEVTRGMMEGEVDEEFHFRFYVPASKKIPGGVVLCSFQTGPSLDVFAEYAERPKLRIVG